MRKLLLAVGLAAALSGSARSALPADYGQVFNNLVAMIDSRAPAPGQMMQGSWLSVRYFLPAAAGLDFNRQRFAAASSMGQTAISGLFLAVHGSAKEHLLVCRELETNSVKRQWLWLHFGSEALFFQRLREGQKFQSLTRTLPSTDGLRKQVRILMNSNDPLTRRTGLFMGSWLVDDAYRWKVGQLASGDPDPVTRACAGRLLTLMR